MKPADLQTWPEIFRNVMLTLVATFMLVYATAFDPTHNIYVIGGGLTLFGIPPALILDKRRRQLQNGGGDDPFEGPGGYYRNE